MCILCNCGFTNQFATMDSQPKAVSPTYFISGHLDITQEEFSAYYVPAIRAVVDKYPTCNFVVGDSRGADVMAQRFLHALDLDHERVRVYHMYDAPLNNPHSYKTVGGFKSHNSKDAAMTSASQFDIAWVRPGRESSGTLRNLERRAKKP